jgi:uncharacterized protein
VTVHVDTSAVTKLYVEEHQSPIARELLSGARWSVARHTYVEVRRALHGRLRGDRLGEARDAFEQAWRDADVIELDNETCRMAADLVETTSVKTLDALHLAAAQRAGGAELTFVTFDHRQAEAARSLGWTVAGA